MFRGVFAPIPTPFDADGEVALPELAGNLKRWAATELSGLVVLGSNGECVYLSEGEKESVIDFVRSHYRRDRPVIAGTGCESTRDTIRLTRRASDLGASAALVITPSYYKGGMSHDALGAHFQTVAESSPIPVMLYNMPRNTGLNMPPGFIGKCAGHPNIVGVKDSSGDIVQIAETIRRVPPNFSVFAGSGSFLFAAMALGAVGGTLAVANVIPNQCSRLARLVQDGQYEQARKLQLEILRLNAAVTSVWGIAGLKRALDLIGYYGGQPRPPLLPFPKASEGELLDIMAELGLLTPKSTDESG